MPFTAVHQIEVLNAFELLVERKQITRDQCRAIQAQLRTDVEEQRLLSVSLDLDRMFADACELSRLYIAKHIDRSLDLLHVAAANLALCTTFVSADDRHRTVAKASGLATIDIKRRTHRRNR